MNAISQMFITISEITIPAHGAPPWVGMPVNLMLRSTNKGTSKFDNRFSYHGRDGRDYIMEVSLTTIGISTVSGALNPKTVINLPSLPLEPLGDGYFGVTWLNVVVPGSGLCKVTIYARAEQ